MLSIEEYIVRRKKEDKLDEFDTNQRAENMRICVNYVFEYFNNYLNITEAEERTVLKDEKLDKYRQQLRSYESEVREWLVGLYSEHGKHMNRNIGSALNQEAFFLLFDSDSEFRSLSYECYSNLIKRFPFLKDQTEMLFRFIKEYHRVESQRTNLEDSSMLPEEICEWIQNTWRKHQVNILAFADEWVSAFYDAEETWPVTHRRKSKYSWRKYDYDHKQKSNLFNLDSLYKKMPKKSFIKGRKQELEIIMMYYWLHSLEGDAEGYWQEYLEKVILGSQ
jgi:hypothetical protein